MSQMSYADAHLETALTAMFERKVNENRSSMRYWPTVSDRLGEQVSRRPWEYVMDAIYKLRLPVKPQYVQSAGGALVVVIAVLLLILFMNTDDTSNGGSAPADSPQQTVPESGGADPGGGAIAPAPASTSTPTSTPAPTATTVPSTARLEPEPLVTPTPDPVALLTDPLTVGAERQFPVSLTGDLFGIPSITLWAEYLKNGALEVQGDYWHLCGRGGDSGAGTGVAEGSLLNGALVYFLGFPTPNMASNEAFLVISDDDEASWQSFVRSYQSGSAVLIPAEAGPYGRRSRRPGEVGYKPHRVQRIRLSDLPVIQLLR